MVAQQQGRVQEDLHSLRELAFLIAWGTSADREYSLYRSLFTSKEEIAEDQKKNWLDLD